MVLPLGIEPSSTALQTAAMTTSAKAALGYLMGFEPTLSEPQPEVLTANTTDTIVTLHATLHDHIGQCVQYFAGV
jgi:hypothetical protein